MTNRSSIGSLTGLLTGLALGLFSGTLSAATLDIATTPLFLTTSVKPNVVVMLDNSGSMKDAMYQSGLNNLKTGFNPGSQYYGIFDATKNYRYKDDIPVNTGAYSVTIQSGIAGAFVEATCTPSAGDTTCWSGNFLNWMTTRRIDATRAVLVGGKLESRSSYNYGTDFDGNSLSYKLVGNNERDDRTLRRAYSASDDYSPIPNNAEVVLSSPADDGAQQTSYDPYPKLTLAGGSSSAIYNSSGSAIGEFGSVSTDEHWATVSFSQTYSSPPVVIAKPPTQTGGDPSEIRIRSVSTAGFQVRVEEWDYRDGGHTDETIGFIVLKAGAHTLDGGNKIIAGTVTTSDDHYSNDCGHGRSQSDWVSFSSSFSSTPVVVSSVQTTNDTQTVNSRTWDISSSGFKVALQEEEQDSGHSSETVGWVAMEPGTVDDTGAPEPFKIEVGRQGNLDENNDALNFSTSFSEAPVFVAALQTMNDTDTAVLRLQSINNSGAVLQVEEEQSCDNETNHSNETFGYFAMQGATTAINLALAVADEPIGLLHDVQTNVNLGISFYRYNPNANDIYTGNQIDGGTLKFKIPNNPFVKKPSASGGGGYRELDGYVGTSITDIVDAIEHYPLIWGTTPIAENLWEVIQYFEQDTPYYANVVSGFPDFERAVDNPGIPALDPYYSTSFGRTLQCIRSNVLIFTDGYPYRDAKVPTSLNNYDRDATSESASTTNNAGSPSGDIGILDDVGYWAYCDDDLGTASCAGLSLGTRDLRTDTGMTGDQFVRISTVGFADGNIRQTLQDTADNAGGSAYAAEDGLALATVLKSYFKNAVTIGSASAVASNSTQLNTGTLIFQARFDAGDWSGQLRAFTIDPSDGSIPSTPTWDTDTSGLIPAYGSRSIYSFKPDLGTADPGDGDGINFTWANLEATTQQTAITATQLAYIRGDTSNEEQNGGSLRDRSKLLGDIINSNPWYAGTDDFGYSSLSTGGSSYATHLSTISGRTKMVYVGANDGMLHAFNAASGAEMFGYVPAAVLPDLYQLTSPQYGRATSHRLYVDGSVRVGDAYYSSAWHSVLVGTTGGGARAVFGLDVTDPDNFDQNDVLWEFTNNSTNGGDLGYTLPEPSIVPLPNGKFGALIGNGYNSDNGHAVLYILDVADGSIIKKIDTGVGSTANPNGLATPIGVDTDYDKVVDRIYAGDLYGNLWRFEVSNASTVNWGVAFAGNPLFAAADSGGTAQPITAKPQVGGHTGGGVMVYFGTGKYFETTDNIVGNSPQVQTYYGIRDNYAAGLTSQPISGRTNLVAQTIDAEGTHSGYDVRVTSTNSVDYTTKVGWYMELESPTNGAEGERVVSPSLLRSDRLIFTTIIPSDDPCATGGTTWLMEVDAQSGARLTYSPFDLNGDDDFTSADEATLIDTNNDGSVNASDDSAVVSGKKSTIGITRTPTVVSAGNIEYKYASGSSGDLEQTVESAGVFSGRQAWRQLQ